MINRLNQLPPFQRAIAKAHLCSAGARYEDLDRPIVAVVNTWNEIVPGHAPLRELAEHVKRGIIQAGGTPLEFNTIAICDGITQGHCGMNYVLPSRELIADSVETMILSHDIFDGMVLLGSCDKIVPALMMAAARINLPSILVSAGPNVPEIKPRDSKAARQSFLRGEIDEKTLVAETLKYYPGPGICPYLGTANTMGMLTEAIGLALPGNGLVPAQSSLRFSLAEESGIQVVKLIKTGIFPKQILSKESFENAIKVLLAIGGSLNAVLHLLALAKEVEVDLTLEDFDRLSRVTPFLTAVVPNDQDYTVVDIHRAGGTPAVMKRLEPLLHTEIITVTGQTVRDNLLQVKEIGELIHSLESPLQPEGGLVVLYGSLAPDGALLKRSAISGTESRIEGVARVFNSEEECLAADNVSPEEILVVRYEGPAGGPGMRELHRVTEFLQVHGGKAILTDGRFSGASGGISAGYISPEAYAGGPIALVQNGDRLIIDLENRLLDLMVTPEELAVRRGRFVPVQKKASPLLQRYARRVSSANLGAIVID
ncbi:dihydroxy-acid dehydratase [Desulfosporosinus fructosivorans]|uniref:Dihydroxy-acid dehydratase n=1 Tax=Desulfosporosinus fructosivorans TaxID=2018669 RepID=A0A4Z0R7Y2_9FIRM|nr:dihydroxy-acid dehydratase [Desulfosporosinus fructosivorans]TGE38515.1 dihydroxy-acid dehydratase [Desulfosporosinus fructosivorans]